MTNSSPKCLTQINGVSILERLIHSLQQQGFKKLIVVVGHFESCLLKFLDDHKGDLVIETIINPLYASTNNIYSLWLARNIIQEPFLLLESDLIFETTFLEEMLEPDKIAVSRVKPWMNGTMVTMNAHRQVSSFWLKNIAPTEDIFYKTVNIYSLSQRSWQKVVERLDEYVSKGRVKEYYEVAFKQMIEDGNLSLDCVFFDKNRWYEVAHWMISETQSGCHG